MSLMGIVAVPPTYIRLIMVYMYASVSRWHQSINDDTASHRDHNAICIQQSMIVVGSGQHTLSHK